MSASNPHSEAGLIKSLENLTEGIIQIPLGKGDYLSLMIRGDNDKAKDSAQKTALSSKVVLTDAQSILLSQHPGVLGMIKEGKLGAEYL